MKRTEKTYKRNEKTINKMVISTYLSVITLNVNGLNAPIKRHRVADWIKKNKTFLCAAYKRPMSELKTHRLKVREWKKMFHTKRCSTLEKCTSKLQ